jgi:hypothetical protein
MMHCKLLRYVSSLYSHKKTSNIKEGGIYAVHTGKYAGEMLIFIKSTKVDHCFLSIPNISNRNIPKIVFDRGIKTKIVQFVEEAPKDVLKISKEQYSYNENSHNRLQ